MPLVGATLEDGIGHEPAGFAVFGTEVVSDDAIFLNGVGGNRSIGSALAALRAAQGDAALALFVVIDALDQVIAGSRTRTIHGRTTEGATGDLLGDRAGYQVNKIVRIASFKRHLLPNPTIDELGDRSVGGLNQLSASLNFHCFGCCAELQLQVMRGHGSYGDHDIGDVHSLETLGGDVQDVSTHDRKCREAINAGTGGNGGALVT